MKRKTFVKQLQGLGIQRNQAASMAAVARKKATSYCLAQGIFLNTHNIFVNSGTNPMATADHGWFASAPWVQWQGRGTA